MLWRVQSAWSGGIHTGFAGLEENLARRDVARLLDTWILVNLSKTVAKFSASKYKAFAFEAKMAGDAIMTYLAADDVWKAYDTFHDFLDRHEGELEVPTWLAIGTVILEAPPGKGPNTRKRFVTEEDFPPKYRPNLGASLGSSSLGVFKRWTVSSTGIGGSVQSSIFLKEDEALARVTYLMDLLSRRLHAHASAEAVADISEDRRQYADDAIQLVFQLTDLLRAGYPILAMDRWIRFEQSYAQLFTRPTLGELVGSVSVVIG